MQENILLALFKKWTFHCKSDLEKKVAVNVEHFFV